LYAQALWHGPPRRSLPLRGGKRRENACARRCRSSRRSRGSSVHVALRFRCQKRLSTAMYVRNDMIGVAIVRSEKVKGARRCLIETDRQTDRPKKKKGGRGASTHFRIQLSLSATRPAPHRSSMVITAAQRDILARLRVNASTGLSNAEASSRRRRCSGGGGGGGGTNAVRPPIDCPKWICCLL
jgi:hypothetical protein